jgi:DNA-3-methyladenine glycosylase II
MIAHRTRAKAAVTRADSYLSITLRPRPPFRLDLTVWALRRRPHNLVDRFEDGIWRRVLIVAGQPVGVAVAQIRDGMRPQIEVKLFAANPEAVQDDAIAIVSRTLGLDHDLSGFYRMADSDSILGPLRDKLRGMKPVRFPTVFEAFANAVACQLVSLSAGMHVLNRVSDAFGIEMTVAGVKMRSFATAEAIARTDPDTLRALGLSRQKASYLIAIAQMALIKSNPDFADLAALDDAAAIAHLSEIRGIGRWTAEYVLLRAFGRVNIFPGDDVGGRNGLCKWLGVRDRLGYEDMRDLLARWHPYAGLIYLLLLVDEVASI